MPRHQREPKPSRNWCKAVQLFIVLVVLVGFIKPSSQQSTIDLHEYCTSKYFLKPSFIQLACKAYLSRDITDSKTVPTTSLDSGQRRPMTDPPRLGKRAHKRTVADMPRFNTGEEDALSLRKEVKEGSSQTRLTS
ncbi:uncharacterized protein [Amphiura filiformis]|uniref:uncharacterized protein n=1 Tax=Amphiura filiformis TaxID=82378 RepID=UPI003B222C1F